MTGRWTTTDKKEPKRSCIRHSTRGRLVFFCSKLPISASTSTTESIEPVKAKVKAGEWKAEAAALALIVIFRTATTEHNTASSRMKRK